MKRIAGLMLAFLAVPALAGTLVPEAVTASYAGHAVVDYATGQMTWNGATPRVDVVYSNITNGPTSATAGPIGALIGDDLMMTGGGPLSTVDLSIYNSSSSARDLQSGTLFVDFWNLGTGTYIGGFSYFLDFGASPLPPGFYTTLGFTGLEGLGIVLPQNIIAGQSWDPADTLGGPSIGQVMMNPPTVGTSDNAFYYDDTAVGGTDSGWFWFGSTGPVANFYWAVGVPEPSAIALLALGGLALIRRR